MQVQHRIIIKGMACQRCINTIRSKFRSIDLEIKAIHLGEVTVDTGDKQVDLQLIREQLEPLGFSLVEDKKLKIAAAVKGLVAIVYSGQFDFPYKFRFSDLVEKELQRDFGAISAVFSSLENQTLEKYIIQYRVEKARELMMYSDETLSGISFRLGFSSVAHLSSQFKSQTGLNPSFFLSRKKKN
ncbi:AraC family transcriptional regulator [Flavihumibacter stibioxidans]|uniref:HTH araC/xylS-type domain-containing protein n=1 Tax=Flavihumibacter stibioxidans TaxID=1834163 RepID=A0ABR7MCM5_9BACT|nr:helix-turn-helix domain-containing protein [Flavihumibacter stibioxidans]MBC6492792.1 hypothetical protein [Flavihumibacter stibioxidans]